MKTPIVHELRRAGHLRFDDHARQKALVERSLLTAPEGRLGPDRQPPRPARRAWTRP